MCRPSLYALIISLALAVGAAAQSKAPPPARLDGVQIWAKVKQPAFLPGRAAAVSNLTLERDRIRLTLTSGTINFAEPVNGVVTGAAFRGSGRLQVDPPNSLEAQQVRLFTKQDKVDVSFSEAVLEFTDATFDEVAGKVKWDETQLDPALGKLFQERMDFRESYGAELLPRIVKGVLSGDRKRTELFYVEAKTSDKGWVYATLDALDPEEISVGRWVTYGVTRTADTWMSFPRGSRSSAEAWKDPLAHEDFLPVNYKIFAEVTGGAELAARTVVEVKPQWSGETVLQFLLDSNLRVTSVKDTQSRQELTFMQAPEQKERVQSYGEYVSVFFPTPLEAGKSYILEFNYTGKRVVRNMGAGVYFCQSFGWYPARQNFALRSNFELNFRSPGRYSLAATGEKLSESKEGGVLVSTWKSEKPIAVAGFAFGDVKIETLKVGNVEVAVYANKQPDDETKQILQYTEGGGGGFSGGSQMEKSSAERELTGYAMGQLSPAQMAGQIAADTANSIQLFERYFGPYPYKHLAVSTIPAGYGQGWPGLLYLSALTFMDSFQRRQLRIDPRREVRITDFFRAHETSHQWWGHKVSWKSYHDQWLSEGFAEFSGNLYVQLHSGWKEYLDRLLQARRNMALKDTNGHAFDSVGPIWMGRRLSSSESPAAYNELVYEKGGYALHMLRMMLYNPQDRNPDARFQEMMRDFTQTFDNGAASTEDFKAIVEKHMTPSMDLEQNGKMDWFFRQYVYGTGIPQYSFQYTTQDAGGGQTKVTGKVVRTGGVPDGWKDILPLYLSQGGKATRLGFINAVAKETPFEFTLPLKFEKLSLNENLDILADVKNQ